MTTIINPGTNDSGNGVGTILGVVLVIIVLILFFVYGLPALRGGNDGGTDVNIPDDVNVNVNPGDGAAPQQ